MEVAFHVLDEFELVAAAVEVVAIPVGFEIEIPFEVIGEEAEAGFEGHELGGEGEEIYFGGGEEITGCIQESLGKT